MTYPLKFREKVFITKDKFNLTFEQTSERFDVPIRTLFRWQNKIEPCSTRNKPATKIDMQALAKDVESSPDDYQWERARRFRVAERTIGYALKRLGISYKKTLRHPKANEEVRITFQNKISAYELESRVIVYLDESGFAQDMPRTQGYSCRGKRCYGVHNWHSKGRINAIGAIAGFAFLTVALFEGNINSEVFYVWLTQELIPVLPENAIVVMDNASFHKRTDMINAIEQSGCQLEFLPPYSPDLNPIEKKWAQAKAIRRRERCDVDTLFSMPMDYDNL